MKKLICLILLSCILAFCLTSCINSANYLGVNEKDDGTVTVWAGEAMYLSRITIPSKIDGKPVVAIDISAFRMNDHIREVNIKAGPTEIGNYAFGWCRYLEKVTLPDTITDIGSDAFYSCYSLEEIKIPNGVTDIKSRTFYNCRSLELVDIPASVTSIAEDAFTNCTSLKTIRFGGSKEEWMAMVDPNSADLKDVAIICGK